MANHNSAKKAFRQTQKRTAVNKNRASRIKTFIKKALNLIDLGSSEEATQAFTKAQSEILKGVSHGIMKPNTAARKVSRLANKLKTKVIAS